MRVMIFPIAFMANTFAMALIMIGLSLFGNPELAADFGLVHGKRPANSPCVSQAGVHRCGSNWSISLARCVGSRVSTSLR